MISTAKHQLIKQQDDGMRQLTLFIMASIPAHHCLQKGGKKTWFLPSPSSNLL